MTEPIKPKEAKTRRIQQVPNAVIEAFNHTITENLRNGYASFLEKDVIPEILKRINQPLCAVYTVDDVYKNGWLTDISAVFRKAGWKVFRDRPGYNESYETRWEFTENHHSDEED